MIRILKPVGALAAAIVFVALGATPAGAAAADVTGGTLSIETTPPIVFDISGAGSDPCTDPTPPPAVDVTFDGDATSGTFVASTPTPISARFQFPGSANWYQLDLSIVAPSGQGTYVGNAPTYALASAGPAHLVLQGQIFAVTPPSCTLGPPMCTLRTRVVLTTGSTMTSSTMPTPASNDVAVLEATSNTAGGVPIVAVAGSCDPVISMVIGEHVSATGLTLQF